MEIIVAKLQQMLKKLKPVAGDSVRLECTGGKFRASVFNNDKECREGRVVERNDLWMEVAADHACEEPVYGSCPIYYSYKDLVQLFSGANKSAFIAFSSEEITCKGVVYRLAAGTEFPAAKPHKRTIALNVSGLKNVMRFVQEDLRPNVCGVNVKADGHLFFTGTDGRILKQVDMGKTRSKFDVTIPYEASKLLSCSKSDQARFGHSKTTLSFEYDDITIVTGYRYEKYPDVSEAFESVKDDITITVDRVALMQKVLSLGGKYGGGMLFKAVDTKSFLEFSAKSEHCTATGTIDADISGTGKFKLNPNLLYGILDSIETDQVTFKLSDWERKVDGPIPPVGVVGADNEQICIMRMKFSEREG